MTSISPAGFSLADLRGHELAWIFEFRWAGQVLYLAEQTLRDVPAGEDGATVECMPGLQWGGEQADELDLLQDTLESKKASVTLHLYPHLDVPNLISEGHLLGAATGKLRLWARDTDTILYVIDGDILDPTWDLPETPIACTLEESPVQDRALWPPSTAVVDATGWPLHDSNIEGEYYPWVFGGPGSTDTSAPWTPGLLVDTTGTVPHPSKILIAGHAVLASSVQVVNVSQGTTAARAVQSEPDGYGRVCSYVEPAVGWASAGDEIWVNWYSGSTRVYGHPSPTDTTLPLRGAGDLLVWWLSRSTVRWDRGRLAAIRDRLNEYKLDTYAMADPGSRITPYHWVMDNLLPLLPVSPRIGPHGLYFVDWDLSATAQTAVAHLEEGRNCSRAGDVTTTSRDDVTNELTITYSVNPRTGSPTARTVLTGDDGTLAEDGDAHRSFHARRSRSQYGKTITGELTAEHVQDPATAGRILSTELRRRAAQWELMAYHVDQEVAGRLTPGDVVTLTDADRYIEGRPCLVVGRPWVADRRMTVDLQAVAGAARLGAVA